MSQVSVREAAEEDESFLRTVFEAVRAEQWAHLQLPESQKSSLIDMQFRAQRMHYQGAFPNASYRVILVDGTPAGMLTVAEDTEGVRLVDIAVMPERQNQGIGAELIRELMQRGKPVSLNVGQSNPARRLYERLGFQVVDQDAMYLSMTWNPRR